MESKSSLTLRSFFDAQVTDQFLREITGQSGFSQQAVLPIAEGSITGISCDLDKENRIRLSCWFSSGHRRNQTASVTLTEQSPFGPMEFRCNLCKEGGCWHVGAALLIFQAALRRDSSGYRNRRYVNLIYDLKNALEKQTRLISKSRKAFELPADLKLVGMGLLVEVEDPLLRKRVFTESLPLRKQHGVDFGIVAPHNYSKLIPLGLQLKEGVSLFDEDENKALLSCWEYHFSNGEVVNSREIFHHPYLQVVPKEMHISLMDTAMDDDAVDFYLSLETSGDSGSWLGMNVRFMLTLHQRILDVFRKGKIDLYLQDRLNPDYAFKISDVQRLPELYRWSFEFIKNLQEVRINLEPRQALGATADLGFAQLNLGSRQVCFSDPKDDLQMLYRALSAQIDTRLVGNTIYVKNGNWIDRVRDMLRRMSFEVFFLQGEHRINPDNFRMQLNFSRFGQFSVGYDLKDLDLKLSGFSAFFAEFVQSLESGFVGVSQQDPRQLASNLKKYREMDLKILKHRGIFLYFVFEVLSIRLRGAYSDGTPAGDFKANFKFLSSKLAQLLLNSAGMQEPDEKSRSLKGICSPKVIEEISIIAKALLENLRVTADAYTTKGHIELENIVQKESWLIYHLILRAIQIHSPNIFLKPRFSFFELIAYSTESFSEDNIHLKEFSDQKVNNYDLQIPGIDSKPGAWAQAMSVLSPLQEQGVEFYLEGEEIEALSETDFRAEFSLNTAAEDLNNSRPLDWFALNPKFFFKGKEVPLGQELHIKTSGIIEYQGRLYRVPQSQMTALKRLENFWAQIQGKGKKADRGTLSERVFKLPRHQILELLALRVSGFEVSGGPEWQEVCDYYDSLGKGSLKKWKSPKSLKAELKPYQKEGVQWLLDLYHLRMGALLADDMGLGKTLQTLCFLEKLRVDSKMGPVLIVMPSSLTYNWAAEIQKFTPDLPMKLVGSGADLKGLKVDQESSLVVLTTYGVLTENPGFFESQSWNILIFDEAQNLKNILSQRTAVARGLKANFKVCLSGTPMENHMGEFYSLIDLIVPGALGSIENFRQIYVNPSSIQSEDLNLLKLKTKPLVLRRTKKEILQQLPDKTESKVVIPFEVRQKNLYRNVATSFNEQIQQAITEGGESKCQLQMLTALLRLRQVCSDPAALPNVKYSKVPPKVELLKDALAEIVDSGESALVFTQFVSTLNRVEKILLDNNIPVFSMHGALSAKERKKHLQSFDEASKGSVMLMTLKTGGVGLNLTKASYVFHLDPWWNPAVENQATDRAHRLGQHRNVQVFRYIMQESVEEKMELLKARKSAQFDSLFTDQESLDSLSKPSKGPGLSRSDFDYLIS